MPWREPSEAWSRAPDVTHRSLVPWPMAIAIGSPVFCMRLGTVETSSVLSWCSLSRTQSGEPDARGQILPRVDQGGTHWSTLNMVEPGGPVSGRSHPEMSGMRVSQGNLTLSPHTCRKAAMREPIGRCSTRHLRVIGGCPPCFAWSNTQSAPIESRPWGRTHRSTLGPASTSVWRSGSKMPSYGGTHQERHLHAVFAERGRKRPPP